MASDEMDDVEKLKRESFRRSRGAREGKLLKKWENMSEEDELLDHAISDINPYEEYFSTTKYKSDEYIVDNIGVFVDEEDAKEKSDDVNFSIKGRIKNLSCQKDILCPLQGIDKNDYELYYCYLGGIIPKGKTRVLTESSRMNRKKFLRIITWRYKC